MATDLLDLAVAGFDHRAYAKKCHEGSLALIRSGVLGKPARVARGSCRGVPGQHSWVVLGEDCYNPRATVIDVTLWSYDLSVRCAYQGEASERPHLPHGSGSIWQSGKPTSMGGPSISLPDDAELSQLAWGFLQLLGPLDRRGWSQLAHSPVGGWPAGEILAAMSKDERLQALVPIDVLGMTTDLNPCELYR